MKRFMTTAAIAAVTFLIAAGISFAGGQKEPGAAPSTGPVKFTFWHLDTATNQKAYWQGLADAYMKAHPNVRIEITVLENEAFKSKLTTVMQSGKPARPFPQLGRRRPGRVRQGGPPARHHQVREGHRLGQVHGARRLGGLRVRRQAVRRPLRHGRDHLLVQQGPPRQGRLQDLPDRLGRLPRPGEEAQGRRHHPDRPRRRRQVAGHAHVVLPRPPPRRQPAFDNRSPGKGKGFNDPPFVQGRPDARRPRQARKPFQDGFLGATYADEGGSRRQRPGRHGADGPVGVPTPRTTTSIEQEGHRRQARHRSLPRRSRAARARSPTSSAAATATRSARTPPTRRWTSSSSSRTRRTTPPWPATGGIIPTVKGADSRHQGSERQDGEGASSTSAPSSSSTSTSSSRPRGRQRGERRGPDHPRRHRHSGSGLRRDPAKPTREPSRHKGVSIRALASRLSRRSPRASSTWRTKASMVQSRTVKEKAAERHCLDALILLIGRPSSSSRPSSSCRSSRRRSSASTSGTASAR